MDQSQRMKMLDDFRAGEVSILAASDVAARGLDIPGVSHVFNYDSPVSPEDYVHRIGRTGRAGREGYAATIVTDHDLKGVDAIKSLIKQDLEWLGASPTDAMDDAQSPTASTGKKGAKESRKPKPDTKGKSRSTGQKSEGKNPGNRKNKTSKDPLVIGMGDHVPAFMTRTI
jgi:ATP-dependent RNA helicase RhlE